MCIRDRLRTGSNIRRTYNDGVRANFNNGRLGFSIGLHNKLFDTINENNDNTKDGNIAVDLQAAFMILPGLEGRLGYAHESVHNSTGGVRLGHYTANHSGHDEIERFNAWLGYNQGPLTLALEYDDWDIVGVDAWNVMLLGRYQVNPLFALTVRYSHEDLEKLSAGNDVDVNRLTLYAAFALTDNLRLGLEYTHSGVEEAGGSDYDVDEFYAETVLSF